MTENETIGACSECGSEVLWAWYPEFVRQTIVVEINDGVVTYDYDGITDSSGESGEDDGYLCGGCGRITDTIYEMVGLLPTHEFIERALLGLEDDLRKALDGVQRMAFQDKPWWPEACALDAKLKDSRIRESGEVGG